MIRKCAAEGNTEGVDWQVEYESKSVDHNSAGTDSGNNGSSSAVLSADGRFVVFTSRASDLVANDTNERLDVLCAQFRKAPAHPNLTAPSRRRAFLSLPEPC